MAQPVCANTLRDTGGTVSLCTELAPHACNGCKLVTYCSKGCQQAHWKEHKKDCKSPLNQKNWKPDWVTQRRSPAFIGNGPPMVVHGGKKYLWGNLPAIDVIKLNEHEGVQNNQTLRLLFAASGDLRNVVKSIAGLPDAFNGQCQVVINDFDSDIVARNLIFLLVAMHFEPSEAVPLILHLWYSTFITAGMHSKLKEHVLPLITTVCRKIKEKDNAAVLSKTWTFGKRSLSLVLTKEQWDYLPRFFEGSGQLTADEAQKIRSNITMEPQRKDYVHRALYCRPPGWRLPAMKYREDGMLLPFGMHRAGFTAPNPTFFHGTKTWPMMDSADPLDGWLLADVLGEATNASNDIYGSLYHYLTTTIHQFCEKVHKIDTSFTLFQVNAVLLPTSLARYGRVKAEFDRIEISNITDGGYVGVAGCLYTFGPMLKTRAQNEHATLLAYFMNAIMEMTSPLDHGKVIVGKDDAQRVERYLGLDPFALMTGGPNNPDVFLFMRACTLLKNDDHLFKAYMDRHDFDGVAKFTGMTMVAKNTFIEDWPYKIKRKALQVAFDHLLWTNMSGCERYCEWQRA